MSPRPSRSSRLLRLVATSTGLLLVAAFVNVAYAALAQERTAPDVTDEMLGDPDLVERGEALFGRHCALCHGEAGRGVPQEVAPRAWGPPLTEVGAASADFMLRTGRMPLDNSNTRLRHQEQKVTDAERRALVAYIASLGQGEGPEIPDVSGYGEADLSTGMSLYTSNCAACHGPTGAGIAVGQRDVSSSLDMASPLEIAEAIRTGPGVMPVFGPEAMSDEELDAVVHWIMDLRERPAPGGAQVGRSGPVWEGLVAWVLGMGLLTIVMYLLGQKATGDDDAEPNA